MVYDEKLKKICNDFSLLGEEQQDYILGILQALVFAKTTYCQTTGSRNESKKNEMAFQAIKATG